MSSSISSTTSASTTPTSTSSTSSSNSSSTQSAQQTAQQVLQQIGIGTTLPLNQILTGLMQVESIPLTQLQNQVSGVQTEISAYGTLSSALSTFQQSLTSLTLPTQFQSLSASVTDSTVFSASAVYGAQPGNYTVNVTQVAQAQTLVAAGQASLSSSLLSGSGPATVTIAFGTTSGSTFTPNAAQPGGSITINSSNDTLGGLRDAINAANLGVTASIVNDGSSSPYRLVLTSNSTGANESMQITVSGDTGIASVLSYPPASGTPAAQQMTQTVMAQNAQLTVNGLALTSATNTVQSALPGLSLTLNKAGTTTMTVSSDTSKIQTNIDSFVSAYNTLQATLAQLTAYNPSGTNGPLIGDATTTQIQNQISRIAAGALSGTGTNGFTTLAQAGIALNADGSLSVDDSALSTALKNSPTKFAALFGTAGSATNSNVTYLIGGSTTQAGNYPVNITQPATQSIATGAAPAATVNGTILSTPATLSVNIGGVQASVTVPAGAYTQAGLARALQNAINANTAFPEAVQVTQASGVLTIAGSTTGTGAATNQSVTISGSGAQTLFGQASLSGSLDTAPITGASAPPSAQVVSLTAPGILNVSLNGVASSVSVPAGTYSPDTLASAVQNAINTNTTFQQAGVSVNVSQSSGTLSVTSTQYGSQSSIAIAGNGASALFGASSLKGSAAYDVQGTIGGYLATGNGQILTATGGPANGLQVQVTGSTSGPLGTVSYAQGYAAQLNTLISSVTGTSGSIASATNTLNKQIGSLQSQQQMIQSQIDQDQAQYQSQFTALSAALVQLQSTSSFLQQTFNPTTTTG